MKKGIKIAIIGFVISMLMLSVGLVCDSSEGIGRFMRECPEGIALGIAILMLIFIVVGGIGMIVFPLVLYFQYDNKKADQYNEEKQMKKTLARNKKAKPLTVIDKQNNCCRDCGCSCTCDGGCNGDIKKCTSTIALQKGCNHHCNCFIGPMVENFPKKEVKTGRLS